MNEKQSASFLIIIGSIIFVFCLFEFLIYLDANFLNIIIHYNGNTLMDFWIDLSFYLFLISLLASIVLLKTGISILNEK
ncbi:MAG: hypothetical protein ACTSVY_07965 [Candidatus Helarchaeota archaeon]